mgnify:CR=1 FL=1
MRAVPRGPGLVDRGAAGTGGVAATLTIDPGVTTVSRCVSEPSEPSAVTADPMSDSLVASGFAVLIIRACIAVAWIATSVESSVSPMSSIAPAVAASSALVSAGTSARFWPPNALC